MRATGTITRLLIGAALPLMALAIPAHAAPCSATGATPVTVGHLQDLPPGNTRAFTVDLTPGEGVVIELSPHDRSSDSDASDSKTAPEGLMLCDARGTVVAPLPSEVFASGGSLSRADDGTLSLRFVAPTAGRYTIVANGADTRRELLLRHRDVPATDRRVTAIEVGGSDKAQLAKATPRIWSFTGKAGQWVRITATSDSDTVLHLAAPAPDGSYGVIADNDDTDGLNPRILRKLPATGTYFVQVESLADEPDTATLLVEPASAPPPPPPPTPLRAGPAVRAKLASGDDKTLYALSVVGGRTYQLELSAPYDVVLEVGLPDPLEPEDGTESNGFAATRTKDDGTSGSEKLTFTARTTAQVLVQVRAFGIDDSDGSYTLILTESGG
jgi:hypothetical protein